MIILNLDTEEILADKVRVCKNYFTRLRGLLGTKKLNPKEACWLAPCNSIHTLGMRYSIDAYFLNKANRVIAILKNFEPNRFSPVHPNAHSVVEFATGVKRECSVGDKILIKDPV